MGFGGISIWQLLIILAIVLVLFGAKRLRNIGGDLGAAIKGFKKSMREESDETAAIDKPDDTVIDAEPVNKETAKKV